jgi:predicted metal-binding membrane protein
MWMVMTAAMMLPSLVPMLRRYRQAIHGPDGVRLGWLTALAAGGYFFVWAVLGVAVYPMGAALTAAVIGSPFLERAVPLAAGVVVVFAAALQFGQWKARHLVCYRAGCWQPRLSDGVSAWRYGLRLGWHCSHCCGSLMAIVLATGIMDLRAMSLATAAITAERLLPRSEYIVRIVGGVTLVLGLYLIEQAMTA